MSKTKQTEQKEDVTEQPSAKGLLINISKTVRVCEIDPNNISIQQKKVNQKTLEETWVSKWYYGSLYQALIKLLHLSVQSKGELSLEEAVQRIEKSSKDLQKATEKYCKREVKDAKQSKDSG